MLRLVYRLFLQAIPVILMVGLIPYVQNDILLAGIYILIIGVSFLVVYESQDLTFLVFGFITLLISEYFFVSTGVEIFLRDSLLGIMPLWLPILWGYAFVAMRRGIVILERHLK